MARQAVSERTEGLDPRTLRAATSLLAVGHAAWQEGDWSASVDVAGRLVTMLTGTSGHQAAISYRDALLAVRARRSDPTPITEAEAQQHAHAMLTNWMQLRGALLP